MTYTFTVIHSHGSPVRHANDYPTRVSATASAMIAMGEYASWGFVISMDIIETDDDGIDSIIDTIQPPPVVVG
jgi:Ni,Fe-hydrogenase I small subunit